MTRQGPQFEDVFTLQIQGVSSEPLAGGNLGITLHTSRGSIPGILHPCEGAGAAVIWVSGAIGGFDGPADALYPALSDALVKEGLASLRLSYRIPGHLTECTLDTLAGLSFLKGSGFSGVALVGHSFGGAVVISAGSLSPLVKAVAALSSQSHGATGAGLLAPRPLLLVHGLEDTRLPPACSEQIYRWAQEPKELVLVPGASHGLRQCRQELFGLLKRWLVQKLLGKGADPGAASP